MINSYRRVISAVRVMRRVGTVGASLGPPEVITLLGLRALVVAPRTAAVSLEVAPGEMVVAVAPASTGTALARCLAGLARPLAGRIEVGGRDVTGLPPLARRIGYLPAGGALLPHLTVARNIDYGLRRREAVHEVARSWLDAVVERLELLPCLHLLPHRLTGAQRLRVSLARAVACLPQVLVLDQPGLAGGAQRLGELVARAVPDAGPRLAVLVCAQDATRLAGATRTTTLAAQ